MRAFIMLPSPELWIDMTARFPMRAAPAQMPTPSSSRVTSTTLNSSWIRSVNPLFLSHGRLTMRSTPSDLS